MTTPQLDELRRAIDACGSIAELSRRIECSRAYIHKLLKKAETIGKYDDLCNIKFACKIAFAFLGEPNIQISLYKLCPDTDEYVSSYYLS